MTMIRVSRVLGPVAATASCLLTGCSSMWSDLPEEPPPLVSMEEPPALFGEPDDEAERLALPLGSYTGVHVADGRASLSGLGTEPDGVLVRRVVENSPGDAAGIQVGDLLLSVRRDGAAERRIRWPGEWREEELAASPGAVLEVRVDRAGVEDSTRVTVAERVRPDERAEPERYREEQRVGAVLRTGTDVEARRAGLAPGGGAVIVGLAAESPWRAAGLRFGDLVAEVGGQPVVHPQVLLDAVRDAPDDETLGLVVFRGEERLEVDVEVTRRAQQVRTFQLPPLVTYDADRGESELSILLGLLKRTSTTAAWEWRLLWLFRFGGGDADRLEEVE